MGAFSHMGRFHASWSSRPQVKKSSGYLVLKEHSSSSSILVDNFSQGDKRTG